MTISNCKRRQSLFVALLLLPLFSCQVMFNSLWPHGLQHTRPPCPSPSPGVFPSSHPLNWWCHPTISSSVTPFSSCPQSFPTSEYFHIRRLKYWSFSISPSNEMFRAGFLLDWLVWSPCCPRDSQELKSSKRMAPIPPLESPSLTPEKPRQREKWVKESCPETNKRWWAQELKQRPRPPLSYLLPCPAVSHKAGKTRAI